MLLYLLRHGESDGNRDGRFRGRTDFPLTERGLMQAENAAEFLEKTEIKRIYTSPLKRAYCTAEIIANRKKIPFSVEGRLNNIFLGKWEARYKKDIQKEFPAEWDLWTKSPEYLKMEGSETLDSVQKRAVEAVNELCCNRNENVLAVSHRAVIKPLIAGLLNIQKPYFWRLHIDTAALSVLELLDEERGWMLKNLNVNHYLKSFEEEKF